MSEPLVRRSDDIEYEDVGAAEGMAKGVLVGEDHGAPNIALRRFTLAPGGTVPKHTNEIEHEQYVLSGAYTVGIEGEELAGVEQVEGPAEDRMANEVSGEEYEVEAGDSLHIPAGAVHWYRNDGDEEGAFLCAVPTGDDAIELLEE